ncbi:unnamed protein product [Phyllotreta striolata]|uniref:Uncharacterized protein n=1 Tax=Phyllotreta striolata TaxID=444603 RepID=A0A9N9TLD5_PHYSR|nr:unnamed protein product [Phyllotreta striolata]
MSPRPRSLSVDSRDERDHRACSPAPGVTQCHEPCSSSSPYTMRPPLDRSLAQDDTDDEDLDEDPEIDPGQEDCSEVLKDPEPDPLPMPQLQIRRDLHRAPTPKSSTVTSELQEGGFAPAPSRKRHFDQDRPPFGAMRPLSPPPNLRGYHPAMRGNPGVLMGAQVGLRPPDTGSSVFRPGLLRSAHQDVGGNNVASDLSMKKSEPPPPQPPPQNPPPHRMTGFTIADIMGR